MMPELLSKWRSRPFFKDSSGMYAQHNGTLAYFCHVFYLNIINIRWNVSLTIKRLVLLSVNEVKRNEVVV